MTKEQLRQLEREMKALANRRRLLIMRFLKKEKEATVSVISEEIKLSFKSTSRHLAVLSSAGILDKEQRSVEVYYFLATNLSKPVKSILTIL